MRVERAEGNIAVVFMIRKSCGYRTIGVDGVRKSE
jgi:hypothetical protein